MVHRHNPCPHPDIPDDLWPVLNRAAAEASSKRVNAEYDIPYLCGYSVDGQTIYRDRHAPADKQKYWSIHENVEKTLIDMGWVYQKAHPVAEFIEELHVLEDGLNIDDYRKECRQWVKEIGSEQLKRVPHDLDLSLYEDEGDKVKLRQMAAAMDSEKILTKKRKAWAKQFKPTASLKGHPLHYNAAAEHRYYLALRKLTRRMVEETERELDKLFSSEPADTHFAEDASIASQARILTNDLQRRFDQLFNKRSRGLADMVVKDGKRNSKASLHASLFELSGGLSLKTDVMTKELATTLQAVTAENVALIKSIPQQYLGKVQGAVMRSITTGEGVNTLIPALKKLSGQTDRRVRMIAMDQTRKTFNGINLARMKSIGVTKARWIHSGGSNEPRPTHIKMSGKVFLLKDGMYDSDEGKNIQPGQLPNCRCVYQPIVEFDAGDVT